MRCLNRKWQPKDTAIKEANSLLTLDTTTLFGKFEEHEQELIFVEKYEKKVKKEKNKEKEVDKKSIALVTSSSNYSIKSKMIMKLVMIKVQMMKKWGFLLEGTIITLRKME